MRTSRSDTTIRPSGIGSELRAWAVALDSVLAAVEETAWSARRVAELARARLDDEKDGLRAARDELLGLPEHATRLTQTGWMLASIAASYRLHTFRSAFVSERRAEKLLSDLHEKCARKFHDVSSVHGGAFLKVGQLLSARPDLLPSVWIKELEKLQDAAPPIPFSVVRQIVEGDFGKPLYELFRAFDEEPLAAASIGQVHRATTFDGRAVAVKVKRPGIATRVKMDLEMLEAFVASLASSLPETDYATIIGEIRAAVLAELDYRAEAETTADVSAFFENIEGVVAPAIIDALCSDQVLTTSFVPGRKITIVLEELAARAQDGEPRAKERISRILGSLLEAYLRQVLEAGVFQADPHPGNLLVTENDELVLLDFGCSGRLPDETRRRYLELVQAFVLGNKERMAVLFAEIGFVTRSGKPDTLHLFADALLTEIRGAVLGSGIHWPTRAELIARTSSLLRACESDPVIGLPGEFIMIARVFGTLGGQFSKYEPDIDVVRHVMPILGPALLAGIFS